MPPSRASRDEIIRFLDEHLEAPAQADFCPNGIQVEGAEEVSRVVTGVTACMELFELPNCETRCDNFNSLKATIRQTCLS